MGDSSNNATKLYCFLLTLPTSNRASLINRGVAYWSSAVVVAESEEEARLYHPFSKNENFRGESDILTVVWNSSTCTWWQAVRANNKQKLVLQLSTEMDPYYGWCSPAEVIVSRTDLSSEETNPEDLKGVVDSTFSSP